VVQFSLKLHCIILILIPFFGRSPAGASGAEASAPASNASITTTATIKHWTEEDDVEIEERDTRWYGTYHVQPVVVLNTVCAFLPALPQ
jgi:capsular polysaccharide biosynthesis protein